MSNKYVAYYRVSTIQQGQSGLGLEAQRESVLNFIRGNGELISEYKDIESGTSNDREGITRAIEDCKRHGAILVVKEMSRISRGGFKIMVELEEAGITFIESTAPFDPAMVKGIKFVLAKEEREKISDRTTSALKQIKRKISEDGYYVSKAGNKITSLGSPSNLSPKARRKSTIVRKRKAQENPENIRAGAFIVSLYKNGESFYSITKKLNTFGFKTSRGNNFSEVQVKRLYERYNK